MSDFEVSFAYNIKSTAYIHMKIWMFIDINNICQFQKTSSQTSKIEVTER